MSDDRDLLDDVPGGHDRRTFLTTSAAAGVGAYLVLGELAEDALAAVGKNPHAVAAALRVPAPKLSLTWTVHRREDALWLRFKLYNLVLSKNALVRKSGRLAAYVVVEFPPQALMEQVYHEGATPASSDATPTPGTAGSRLADPSRLAFVVPTAVKSIPFTLERLLDWSSLTPSLVPVAAFVLRGRRPKIPAIRAPTAWETAIELPYRLALSPGTGGVWKHDTRTITHDGFSELWRLRLGHLSFGRFVDGAPLRGVWTYEPGFNPAKPPLTTSTTGGILFKTALSPAAQELIVRETSDFKIPGRADVDARRLWLTSIGGTLESRGAWDIKKAGYDLSEWRHITTMGRDQYVKVVFKGHLFPFGHRAVLIEVSERKFELVPGGSGERVAVLRKREFIVVREPVRTYTPSAATPGNPNGGRGMPFTTIRVASLVTPNLDDAGVQIGSFNIETDARKLHVAGQPFLFHMVGHDQSGRDVAFTSPAWFVTATVAFDAAKSGTVRTAYNAAPATERTGAFEGIPVAIAPPAVGQVGRTDVGVYSMLWEALAPVGGTGFLQAQQPLVYPRMSQAVVRLAAAEQASGGAPLVPQPVISFDDAYLASGFAGANRGQLFAKMLPSAVPTLTFDGGSAGGVMTPNINIAALSRLLGPVGGDPTDLADARNATFDPAQIFGGVAAKILGGVDLIDLVAKAVGFDTSPSKLDEALKITHERNGTVVKTHLHWAPTIKSNPIITAGASFSFTLDANATVDAANPAAADFDVTGDLKDFSVHLVPGAEFIQIDFTELTFTAKRGQKSHTSVDIAKTTFKGPLAFVEKLQDLLDFSGDGGPKITITPTGISADMKVPLPDIAVGVFALSNMSIGAGFNLPFSGAPARFRFNFATREDMFHVQVSFLGGGGFFGIAIGTDGVEQIEAALEFGAMLSLDVGVASGEVHIMAGIYYSYSKNDATPAVETCILTGYIRMGGSLDILGIISMSVEFYMGLTYEVTGGHKKVYGDATLTVEVHVLFFSASVDMHVHRQFGDSPGDPTFLQQFPDQQNWIDYCSAFAL